MKRSLAAATAAAFLDCILASNYAISHIGTQPFPGGPHVLPVGFGLSAPSGVYVIGVTFILRDVLQRTVGKAVTFALILVGAALTALFAPSLAFASAVAFLASESADFATFLLAEKRLGFTPAMVASNAVGIVVDSWLFLTLAFGSTAFIEGQIVGKAWATLAALIVITGLRVRRTVTA